MPHGVKTFATAEFLADRLGSWQTLDELTALAKEQTPRWIHYDVRHRILRQLKRYLDKGTVVVRTGADGRTCYMWNRNENTELAGRGEAVHSLGDDAVG